jgi:hypothetical protein
MQKLGLCLIVGSFLPWLAVPYVSLLPLAIAQKAALVPLLVIVAEVSFWLGFLIVGQEAATKYRRYFSPRSLWRKLKKLLIRR